MFIYFFTADESHVAPIEESTVAQDSRLLPTQIKADEGDDEEEEEEEASRHTRSDRKKDRKHHSRNKHEKHKKRSREKSLERKPKPEKKKSRHSKEKRKSRDKGDTVPKNEYGTMRGSNFFLSNILLQSNFVVVIFSQE